MALARGVDRRTPPSRMPKRNPLTAALAAMAAQALLAFLLSVPFPSAATFIAGMMAVAWTVGRSVVHPHALGAAAGFVLFVPSVVPPAFLTACAAAAFATRLPYGDDPLRNVAVALPALTILVLAMTL